MPRARILLLAALFLLVPAGSALAASASRSSLSQALARTAAAGSERFVLDVRMTSAQGLPRLLRVTGAVAGPIQRLHLLVLDPAAPGPVGPATADEVVDGSFLYLRSPLTRSAVGPLWVRLPLAAASRVAAELRSMRSVSPRGLLGALARAGSVRGQHGVYRGRLPFDDAVVRRDLAGIEGGVEYRRLRTTVTVGRDGLVHRLALTGRTADGSSRLSLLLVLRGFDRPVAVQPPRAGTFVDFDLDRLAA